MSDQQQQQQQPTINDSNDLTDPTKTTKCELIDLDEHCEAVRAPHVPDGHTFLVTTIVNETTITERHIEQQVCETSQQQQQQQQQHNQDMNKTSASTSTSNAETPTIATCSNAIVPLSSSLPSKLLRFHAKRSAKALMDQIDHRDIESHDSQFSSVDSNVLAATHIDICDDNDDDDDNDDYNDEMANDCADIYDCTTPTAPIALGPAPSSQLSALPQLLPLSSPIVSSEERLDDVGMGSSIEGSEESEEDDELKPLAVDNHVLPNCVELHSPKSDIQQTASTVGTTTLPLTSIATTPCSLQKALENVSQQAAAVAASAAAAATTTTTAAVLSEANLEKFRRNHPMDNIYLHPNFKHDYDENYSSESSPPPAVAPANSPVEQRRAHRSFLTMKKQTESQQIDSTEAETSIANMHQMHTTHATASTNTDPNDLEEHSGINEVDTLDPSLIPNDELAAEIAEAVEFYFSNESILKDAFLLKHVRRNKDGFVSLKLVSSFKRVRQLTKDWRVVGYAVRQKSRKIELNDLGSKVRRIEPLPTFDETMPSRTIVACDLPLDKLTIEKVSDLFSKCGEIALIRILKPGMAIPVDVRQFMNKYPEMLQKECALVEYLESSSARDAKNLQGPFQVYEMVAPKKKTGKKAIIQVAAPIARMVENYRYYNDATYERTRGGSFSGITPIENGDLRYKLKRNNSDFHQRSYNDVHHPHQHPFNPQHYQSQHYHNNNNNNNNTHHYQSHHHNGNNGHRGSFGEHTHQFQHYQPRGSISHDAIQDQAHSPNGNFYVYAPRRYSNTSTISASTAAAGLGDSSPSTAGVPTSSTNINNNGSNNGSGGSYAHITSQTQAPARRLSNCSDTYYSERRTSNCSEHAPQRRDSNCSESCPCSRRVSDFGQNESYRKTSQCSIGSNNGGGGGGGGGERRFSNGSLQFERTFSNASDNFVRRMSNDYNCERKASLEPQTNYEDGGNVGGGGGGYNVFPRRYSNGFNAGSKLAAYDNAQYINGRRVSTDSGYDRRYSFGSEYEGSPRSRTGSFLNNYKHGVDIDGQPRSRTNSFLDGSPRSRSGSIAQRNAENLVRTPLGPDGSKGFGSRARKFGQTVSPV